MNLESMLHVGRIVGLLEEAVMPNPNRGHCKKVNFMYAKKKCP